MAEGLTAADLARIEGRHEHVIEHHRAVDGTPLPPIEYCAVGAERWPCDTIRLVAAVRELARAIVAAKDGFDRETQTDFCVFCKSEYEYAGFVASERHAPDCPVHRARALVGDEE